MGYARKIQIVHAFIKKGYRRAQNLSERYVRLEKSLRGKEGESRVAGTGTEVENGERTKAAMKEKSLAMFRGVEIPREPKAPATDGEFVSGFVRTRWLRVESVACRDVPCVCMTCTRRQWGRTGRKWRV